MIATYAVKEPPCNFKTFGMKRSTPDWSIETTYVYLRLMSKNTKYGIEN